MWFGYNHPLNVSEPLQGERQTNQRAELMVCIPSILPSLPNLLTVFQAAIRLIENVDKEYGATMPITIKTDSI